METKKVILTIVIVVLIIIILVTVAGMIYFQTNTVRLCSQDSDCTGKQCCHPNSCINKNYKEPCNLLCTNVCEGPLDCSAGSCGCVNGKCSVIKSK
ncbi:Uncharacterised protein [uncultured archaeon]|nr:Uncharacterised protein [uncultured archaeon]